jgi:hypothetical protein
LLLEVSGLGTKALMHACSQAKRIPAYQPRNDVGRVVLVATRQHCCTAARLGVDDTGLTACMEQIYPEVDLNTNAA